MKGMSGPDLVLLGDAAPRKMRVGGDRKHQAWVAGGCSSSSLSPGHVGGGIVHGQASYGSQARSSRPPASLRDPIFPPCVPWCPMSEIP